MAGDDRGYGRSRMRPGLRRRSVDHPRLRGRLLARGPGERLLQPAELILPVVHHGHTTTGSRAGHLSPEECPRDRQHFDLCRLRVSRSRSPVMPRFDGRTFRPQTRQPADGGPLGNCADAPSPTPLFSEQRLRNLARVRIGPPTLRSRRPADWQAGGCHRPRPAIHRLLPTPLPGHPVEHPVDDDAGHRDVEPDR
jgi:hypothetical protein